VPPTVTTGPRRAVVRAIIASVTKKLAPSAKDILAAVRGTLPVETNVFGGIAWTQTIPKSNASAWAFATATDKVGDAAVTAAAATMTSSGVGGMDAARLTLAMIVPSVAASLTHIGTPIEPEPAPAAEGEPAPAPAIEYTSQSVTELFPLMDTRPPSLGGNPAVPIIAELGDPELCQVIAEFVEQLPEPIVQSLAEVASRLQNNYMRATSAAAKSGPGSFQKARPVNS